MSVNIKIGGKTLNDIHAVQFENADAPGTNIQFYDVNSVQEEKTVTPTTSVQEVVPSSEKLLSKVTVEGVTAEIDSNIQAQNIKAGVSILGVEGSVESNKLPLVINAEPTSSFEVTEKDFEGVTSVREYCFYYCKGMEKVTVPDTVQNLGDRCFAYCTDLKYAIIGSGISNIPYMLFYRCTSLLSVTLYATTPPTIYSGNPAFDYTNNCPIYVPTQSVNAYKTASNWGVYASRIQAIPEQ